jgi:hypothetical protein
MITSSNSNDLNDYDQTINFNAKTRAQESEVSDKIEPIWWKTFPGYLRDDIRGPILQQTSDGGFILTGTDDLTSHDMGVILIKTDESGNEQWNRSYPMSDYYAYLGPGSVIQTSDEGYLISGTIRRNSDINFDINLIKTDRFGNLEWSKSYGYNSSVGWGDSIIQTDDGGYIFTGYIYKHQPNSLQDIWVVKLNSSGNIEWEKTFGGNDEETSFCIISTNDNGYAIVGRTGSYTSTTAVWLIKIDNYGNEQWNRTYDSKYYDMGISIKQTYDNGFIMDNKN